MFLDFISNHIILVALSSWAITQVLKFFVAWIAEGHPDLRRLFGDGGMPSGHTATAFSMAAMVGYTCGFASPIFGLALIFTIVVMHDATGVRREAGKQARLLLEIVTTFGDIFTGRQKLKTMVGHTPMQVFLGALFGILVATVYILIFGIEYGAYA